MRTHKDLDVWTYSIDLVTDIYRLSENFPETEIYGLTNQLRRSAISIPSNIAEGAGRNSKNEFFHFLSISLGSLSELETQLIIAKNLGFISNNEILEINDKVVKIRKMLIGLKKSINK